MPPLERVALPKRPVADKARGAGGPRGRLEARRAEPAIPSNAARHKPRPLDRRARRRRNAAGRPVRRLKNWRRVAARYGRLAGGHPSAIAPVAAVAEWAWLSPLPRPSPKPAGWPI